MKTLMALLLLAAHASAQAAPRLVERQRFHAGGGPAEAIAFAPEGSAFATAGSGQVAVWESERDVEPVRFQGRDLMHLAFDPVGRYLAASGAQLVVWDRLEKRIVFQTDRANRAVAWSPDGRWLATSGLGGRLLLLARESFAEERSHQVGGQQSCIDELLWEPDGSALRFVANREPHGVHRFVLSSGAFDESRVVPTLKYVKHMAWIGGGLALFDARGRVRVGGESWKPMSYVQAAASTVDGHTYAVTDGQRLYVGTAAGLDRAPIELEMSSLAYDPSGRLVIGTKDGRVLFDVLGAVGTTTSLDARPPLGESSLAFTPDERFALVAGDARIAVLEIETGHVAEILCGGVIGAGRAGSELVLANLGGIEIWDAATRERLEHMPRSWRPNEVPRLVSLSPDGRTCITGHATGNGLCWKRHDLRNAISVDGEGLGLADVAWTRDGRSAALVFQHLGPGGSPRAGRLRFVHVSARAELYGDPTWASAACFTDEGSLLWSHDGSLRMASGVFRYAAEHGSVELICERSYLCLRALPSGDVIGFGRDGVQLFSLRDGAVLASWRPANSTTFAWYEIEASRSGRWVLARDGRAAQLLEVVR